MGLVWVFLAALALFLVGTPVVVLLQSRFAKKRWGTVEGPLEQVGPGAYRGVVARRQVERGAPSGMTWASVIAAAWAAVTLGIFVPVGALGGAAMLRELVVAPSVPPSGYLLTLLLLLFSASGGVLGAWMIASCMALARRHLGSEERALRVSRYCYAHHGALWLAGTALAMTDPERTVMWSTMLAIPAIVGALAGLALRHAADEALARTRSELFRAPDAPSSPEPTA